MRWLYLAVILGGCAIATSEPEPVALTGDPIAACAIADRNAIAGHEADFYRCAEEVAHCGDNGYLLGYGARYAERFYRHTRPWMSARGQQWIDDVLVCLQRDLREAIDKDTSCPDIREIAYDQHPICYTEAGFCRLSFRDWFLVAATIDGRDWFSLDLAEQVLETARLCAQWR